MTDDYETRVLQEGILACICLLLQLTATDEEQGFLDVH